MPVYQQLVSFDRLFQTLREPPIIINNYSVIAEEDRERISQLIMTKYSSDLLSVLPTCQCGCLTGEYAVGLTCDVCHTPVRSTMEEDIEPILWFQAPEGVAKLINPRIWIMLKQRFMRSGFDILRWLCDTDYHPSVKLPRAMHKVKDLNIERGYNHFVTNFHSILAKLLSLKEFRGKRFQRDFLQDLLFKYPDCIFSDYLPFPNRVLFIIESTNVGRYIDPMIIGAWDAVQIITGIDTGMKPLTVKKKENRAVKALSKLADFYHNFDRKIIAGKPGIFRKHIYATRTHFSFRAVITSITKPHVYDEIEIPWCIGLTAFRPHLIQKLLKRGYSHNESIGLLYKHIEVYNPFLEALMQELIDESPERGIPAIIQRNPSLLHGSAQAVRIARVKPDPRDHTISISILITVAPNADEWLQIA
jgi:hypothetical protein